MMKLRRCRVYAVPLICVFTLYVCAAVWIRELNPENMYYRVWEPKAGEIACYYEQVTNTLPELDLPQPSPSTSNTNIFFLETSCHMTPQVPLTPRQACAVESAAKMNPGSDIYVLFPSPVVDNSSARSPSVLQLQTYPNVRLRHVSLDRFMNGTPLHEWHATGMLRSSHWPRIHTSDVLRYLTLWKYGGIYLDLDVVVTKPLEGLVNFAGAESWEDVAAGVLSFSHHGDGHNLATRCLHELQRDFRGHEWGYNSPGVITRVLKSVCNTDVVKEMTPQRCKGFTVFPPHVFYPIPWRKWHQYFNSEQSEQTLRSLVDSRAIHVWNKFSTQANITVGSRQPYAVIASKYCPRVYSHAGAVF